MKDNGLLDEAVHLKLEQAQTPCFNINAENDQINYQNNDEDNNDNNSHQ